MREFGGTFLFSASDLMRFMGCAHATTLDLMHLRGDLAVWLENKRMEHVRGAPNHPQTQGKIERWHQTLKNRILLENHYLPGALEAAIGTFVDHYNHRRVHESLGNVTPADAYFGRAPAILEERRRIKEQTIRQRRLLNQTCAA
jgi:transposase InsO family protein